MALAVIVGWEARRTWSRLDSVAASFEAPAGMSELARVRQGDGFCFVSCTGGGEAVVTIVLDASELTVDAACEEVRRSVQHLAGDAVDKRAIEDDEQCVYTGDLYDDAGVGGVVARRVDLSELRGTRWMEEEPIPNVALLAWIEINSGIE